MPCFQPRLATEMINRPVLRSRHQPSPRIIRHDRLRLRDLLQAGGFSKLGWVGPGGQGELTAVVANRSGIVELSEVPVDVFRRSDRVALAQLAHLEPGQQIGYSVYRGGQQSDVTELQLVVNEVTRHARKVLLYSSRGRVMSAPATSSGLGASALCASITPCPSHPWSSAPPARANCP